MSFLDIVGCGNSFPPDHHARQDLGPMLLSQGLSDAEIPSRYLLYVGTLRRMAYHCFLGYHFPMSTGPGGVCPQGSRWRSLYLVWKFRLCPRGN